MDIASLREKLLEFERKRHLVPLVGSGISRQAHIPQGAEGFPMWADFLSRLVQAAASASCLTKPEVEEVHRLIKKRQFLLAAQAVRDALPCDIFSQELRRHFDPAGAQPTDIHKDILDLGSPVVLTTNYDRLLEDSFAKHRNTDALSMTYLQAGSLAQFLRKGPDELNTPCIFKMHGDVQDPEHTILTEKDYRVLLSHDIGYRNVVSGIFQHNTVLLLGFSGDDPELSIFFRTMNEYLHKERTPDYLLLPRGRKGRLERKLFRDYFSLEVVEYNPANNHKELSQMVHYLAQKARKAS